MAMKETNKRIQYKKPEAIELGPVAAIIGASCTTGETIAGGTCTSVGSGYIPGRSPSSRDQSDKFSPDLFE